VEFLTLATIGTSRQSNLAIHLVRYCGGAYGCLAAALTSFERFAGVDFREQIATVKRASRPQLCREVFVEIIVAGCFGSAIAMQFRPRALASYIIASDERMIS